VHCFPQLLRIQAEVYPREVQPLLNLGVHAKLQSVKLEIGDTHSAQITDVKMVTVAKASKLQKLHLQGRSWSRLFLTIQNADIRCHCSKVAVRYTLCRDSLVTPFLRGY